MSRLSAKISFGMCMALFGACKPSTFTGDSAPVAPGAKRKAVNQPIFTDQKNAGQARATPLVTPSPLYANTDENASPSPPLSLFRTCSSLLSRAYETDLTNASGVSVKLLSLDRAGEAIELPVDGRATQQALMASGQLQLTLGNVNDGRYDLLLCDQKFGAACAFNYTAQTRPPGTDCSTVPVSLSNDDSATDCWSSSMYQWPADSGVYPSPSNVYVGDASRGISVTTRWLKGTIGFRPQLAVHAGHLTNASQGPIMLNLAPNPEVSDVPMAGCDHPYSPLVIDLGSDHIQLSPPLPGVLFDIKAAGVASRVSWPVSDKTYFLVLDRNGNGNIDDINEMFGDNTIGPDGKKAANGFLALEKYDANGDLRIDKDDQIYTQLRLWHDANANGVVDPGELSTLDELGITFIDLEAVAMNEVDRYGNETRQRSVVGMTDGTLHMIFDVWLKPY